MKAGSFRYGWYRFTVYDDGSLACGNTWYEDPATAARELRLPLDHLEAKTASVLREWAGLRGVTP
jgi:hypothetical protein